MLYLSVKVDNIFRHIEFPLNMFKIFRCKNDVIKKSVYISAFLVSFCVKLDKWPKNVKYM